MFATIHLIGEGRVYASTWHDYEDVTLSDKIMRLCESLASCGKLIVQVEVKECEDQEVDSFVKVYDPTAPHLTFLR